MIGFVSVPLGAGVGVRCTRCHESAPDQAFVPGDDIVAAIGDAVASWSGGPGPNVTLTGPEPFDHPELPALVSAATRAGVERLRLDTDAIALQSPGNAAGALVAGVRHIRFTLLGGTPGVHDALADVPGAFEATLAGVSSYRAAATAESTAVCVTARVPACRHNLHDLPAAVGAAVAAGADAVEIAMVDGRPAIAQAGPWFTAACDTGLVNGVWVEIEGVPFCLLPGYDLHLADALRPRPGMKSPVCSTCSLDALCGGAPEGSSSFTLAELAPPPFADALAPAIARAREAGDGHV